VLGFHQDGGVGVGQLAGQAVPGDGFGVGFHLTVTCSLVCWVSSSSMYAARSAET
jgi:hypothetical protein